MSSKCDSCLPAKCCLYISMEIDSPETRNDFEYNLWMIAHEKVSFYIYRKTWHINFYSRCKFLWKSNQCKIYDKKFSVCRGHSTDSCEATGDYDFPEHFKTYDELLNYIKKKYPRWRFPEKPVIRSR